MLNKFFDNLGITRDSWWFFYGKVAGAVIFLASIGAQEMNMQFGIPLKYAHFIQIAAAWLLYFSAQQSTSSLNGAK